MCCIFIRNKEHQKYDHLLNFNKQIMLIIQKYLINNEPESKKKLNLRIHDNVHVYR